jgi:hypothetical protein
MRFRLKPESTEFRLKAETTRAALPPAWDSG